MTEKPEVLKRLESNPYDGGTELVALTVRELAPQDRSDESGLMLHGANVWRAMQRALIWWTPARVEEAALRRAADDPKPSVLAQEVALFTALYEQYAPLAVEMARLQSHMREPLRFQLEAIRATLEGLERRAQAAESRATDYRLRYEFDKLRQVVAGRELASKVAELIEKAVESIESVDRVRQLVEEFRPGFEKLQHDLSAMRLDVGYTADRIMEESVRRMLPAERVKSAVALLSDAAGAGGVLAQLLAAVGRQLG